MAEITVDELQAQIGELRSNPTLAYDKGKDRSLAEIRQAMASTRAALVDAIENAPDAAFEEQPANDEGEEVWSVGPIVAHCNGSLLGIGGEALKLIELDAGEPPESLAAAAESKIMSRAEALAAASVVATDDFFEMIPDDENLDNSSEHDFFGTMTGRTWLYFMAMHEAEHVAQVKALG